jgi:hypothetical protein
MTKPFSIGRDPRVDIILKQMREGALSHDDARKALTNIGLEQFSEDFDGNASEGETRQTNAPQFTISTRQAVRRFAELPKDATQKPGICAAFV